MCNRITSKIKPKRQKTTIPHISVAIIVYNKDFICGGFPPFSLLSDLYCFRLFPTLNCTYSLCTKPQLSS